jgi:phospholipid transport system substrate-binding protein
MKKFLTFATFLIIIFSNISKVHSIEADVFIQSTVNRAAKALGGNFTKEEKVEKLKDIARDTVDIEGLGFYSLGAYRKDLNESQLAAYTF